MKKQSQSHVQSIIFKNAFFLYGLTFSNYFIGLLLFPYLSRVLSVERFGVIGFATSVCLVFQMIVEYGFQISTTAKVSLHRDDKIQVSHIISTMTYAKAMLAGISSIAFIICAIVMESVRIHALIVSLFFVDTIIKAFLPDAYFRGIERMKDITIRAVVIKSGILIATLILVRGDATLVIYPISMIVCDSLALVWAFVLLRNDGVGMVQSSFKEILQAIKDSFWFFISRVSVSINGSLGSIFLGMSYSPESLQMGLYSGATRLSTAGEQMIPPIGDALYPSMMKKKDYSVFRRIVLVGGCVWFAVCAAVAALAPQLCGIILGDQYISAGNYLRILMFGVFLGFFSFMFGYPALSPIGKATYANAAIMVSACVNLTVCAILWLTDSITPLSICIVFASTNLTVLTVRLGAFMHFRHLAH